MNEAKLYDLHSHTTCSDGSKSPKELIDLAKSVGLKGLSITDHDTIDAYKEIKDYAKESHIDLISGVEFSAHFEDVSVHILGYAFSLDSQEIQRFCQKHIERRRERNLVILDKLKKFHMPIDEEDLFLNEAIKPISVGRPHIAQAMVKKGYVSTIMEAFNRYIGEDCPCFEPGDRFCAEETLEVIKKSGGLSVMAHPHLIPHPALVDRLLQLPFDGMEVFYAKFSESVNYRWLKLAEKHRLLVTGGSDYHGFAKPQIHLACSVAPEASFLILRKHYESRR